MKPHSILNLKKLSRQDLSKITGKQATVLDPEGGTNNGGTTGNIICGDTPSCCPYEKFIINPECCFCVESLA